MKLIQLILSAALLYPFLVGFWRIAREENMGDRVIQVAENDSDIDDEKVGINTFIVEMSHSVSVFTLLGDIGVFHRDKKVAWSGFVLIILLFGCVAYLILMRK